MARSAITNYGTGLRFGVGSIVTVSGATPTVTTGMTVAFWINPSVNAANGPATQRIIRTTDDNIDLFFRASGPNLETKITTTQGSSPRSFINQPNNIPKDTWSFVLVSYDTSTGNISAYVNDTLIGNTARDSTNLISNNTWAIGDAGGGLLGVVDEPRVYNFAFNSSQRTAAYNGTWPTTGGVFAYDFNEGSGSTLTDLSGNGKTGTISGAEFVRDRSHAAAVPRGRVYKFTGYSSSSPDVDSHNGITTDPNDTFYYGFDTPALRKFDSSWALVTQNSSAASDAGVAHLGDGQYYNGFLYCAAENYTDLVTYDHQRIAKFNASDLSLVTTYDISAQAHECSGLTIDPAAVILYVSSYVQSDRVFKYSLTGTPLGYLQLSRDLPLTQGITYRDGFLYIAEDTNKRVWRVGMDGQVYDYFRTQTSTGGGQEGLDFTGKNMLVLDENSGTSQSIIRICPPSNPRVGFSDNLVYNGDFEKYPAFTAATTADNRWIDGTAAGKSVGDSYYGWATNNGTDSSAAQFDTSVFHSGTASMKLSSVSAGKSMEVCPHRDDVNLDHMRYGIPVKPSTSYTLTYFMKTSYTSGDSNDGAFMSIRQFTPFGANVSTTTHTKVKTTVDWTSYTLTFTTASTTAYLVPRMSIVGSTGVGTLIMDAWFDDIVLKQTTQTARSATT